MKKILIFALMLGLVTQLNAQRPGGGAPQGGRPAAAPQSNVSNKEAETALKNYEKAKADITGKKAQDAASWVKYGKAIVAVYDHPAKNVWVGLSALEARVILKDQRSSGSETKTINGDEYEVVHYQDKDLYYDGSGSLAFWNITKPLLPQDLLSEAYEAYKKAYELDTKGAQKKGITDGMTVVQNRHVANAMAANSMGNFSLSSKSFAKSILCAEHPVINQVDTVVVFYTGLTAYYAQEYDVALSYIQRALNMGFSQEGTAYSYIAECYKGLGQLEKVEPTLAEGFTKYPANQGILVSLINLYRENDKDPSQILQYIHVAQENEPNNESLFYAEGDVWKKLNNLDKAVECFRKSIEINPNYLYGHFSIGTSYYDTAADLQAKAAEELDDKKYNEMIDEMDSLLVKAIDPLEKSFSLAATDPTIQSEIAVYLKFVYYRLQGLDEKYLPLYEKYRDIADGR